MGENSRTAKATATRISHRNAARDKLFELVSTGPVRTDWQYSFVSDMPIPAVRRAFTEDPRFPALMRAGKIAVPSRTLRYPRWATVHLTVEEQSQLPTISSEMKLSGDLLPKVVTGDDAMDADIGHLERDYLECARHLSPRRARARLADAAIVFSRVIAHTAETFTENAAQRQHIARLERDKERVAKQLTNAEMRIARLESLSAATMSPPGEPDEPHLHA